MTDGELVALDDAGRPDFNQLQNFRSAERLVYFVFDILFHKGRSLLELPLTERREILRATVVPNEHVQIVEVAHSAKDMLRFVTEHKLEGIIVKRADSKYPPAKRTGLG